MPIHYENALYHYPRCILDIYLEQGDFYIGQVRDGKVYTDQNLVLLLDSGCLANMFVYDDQPGIYEYANPRPLPNSSEALGRYYPAAVTAFETSDC